MSRILALPFLTMGTVFLSCLRTHSPDYLENAIATDLLNPDDPDMKGSGGSLVEPVTTRRYG